MREISMSRTSLLALACLVTAALGCAETSGEERVHVVKNAEAAPQIGGIPPDKEQDIQLLLQQREPSTLRCYQEVLDEKHDRAFKGSVIVVLSLEPAADKTSRAANVKVIGGTLNNETVNSCLIDKLKELEYPEIPAAGSMQYVYKFEPAY
jgi:hypothetical protein